MQHMKQRIKYSSSNQTASRFVVLVDLGLQMRICLSLLIVHLPVVLGGRGDVVLTFSAVR